MNYQAGPILHTQKNFPHKLPNDLYGNLNTQTKFDFTYFNENKSKKSNIFFQISPIQMIADHTLRTAGLTNKVWMKSLTEI